MAIDPMLYQKLSGRKGDPYTRLGEALAKDAKNKASRSEQRSAMGGARRLMWLMPSFTGLFGWLFFWSASKEREK